MTRLKRLSPWMWFLALTGGLTSCAPSQSQAWRNSFFPPAPRSAETLDTVEPPHVPPAVQVAAVPSLEAIPARPERDPVLADAVVREAEAHFQLGKRHYLDGDEEAARREFDRAIDLLLTAPDDVRLRPGLEKALDRMVDAICHYDVSGLGAGDVLSTPGFERSPLEEIPQMTFPIDPNIKNQVIEEVRATISQLPLQVNDAVLSYIHYFSSERGRQILVHGLRHAGRYRAMVRRILDEEGVPQELIYLAQAESGFMPRALSRKKATGMWQFIRERGREYGLKQTAYTDDRLDPERATRSAARHLRDLYHRYGDWYLAMAAYNCGPGVIDRAVQRTGYADFWELRRRDVLPRETANYVPIILAMTIMGKNPKEYGIDDIDPDPAVKYDTVELTAATGLVLISDITESPISEIRDLNPSLLKNIAPSGYRLRIPKGMAATTVAALQTVPPDRRAAWRVHRVGDGETLAGIARRYHVTEHAILGVNREAAAEDGDLLLIPAAEKVTRAAPRHSRSTYRGKASKASAARAGAHSARAAKRGKTGARRGRAAASPASGKASAERQPKRTAKRG